MSERLDPIDALRLAQPTVTFLRVSLLAILLLVVASWTFGGFEAENLFTAQRLENLKKFRDRVSPQNRAGEPMDFLPWASGLFWNSERDDETSGNDALWKTLAIAVAAVAAAALLGLIAMFPAARTFATAQPLLPDPRPPAWLARNAWRALRLGVRAALVFVRSVPEYVWAFLCVAILGPTGWVGVLALAIHNSGVLGRLGAEVVENMAVAPAAALRGLGASRTIIAVSAGVPTVLSRYVLYVFYRWETCVREATILGTLVPGTLGWMVTVYRTRRWHDRVLYFILLGAVLILLGDLVSALARRFVRRAT